MPESVFLGGSSSASLIHQATVTLTDAQIKEWPSVDPRVLVAAPGANKAILPLTLVIAHGAWTAGYGNHGDESIKLDFGGSGQMAFFSGEEVNNLLNTTDSRFVLFSALAGSFGTTTPAEGLPIDLVLPPFTGIWALWANKALTLSASNSLGDYTNGHANNTLTVSVTYMVLNLTTGEYE